MITHVAIWFQGKLYSLPAPNRHHDVIRMIIEETGAKTVDAREDKQGFLVDGKVWCRRKPALRIARECGQLIALKLGGKSTADNLVACCEECNSAKGHMSKREWEKRLARIGIGELSGALLGVGLDAALAATRADPDRAPSLDTDTAGDGPAR